MSFGIKKTAFLVLVLLPIVLFCQTESDEVVKLPIITNSTIVNESDSPIDVFNKSQNNSDFLDKKEAELNHYKSQILKLYTNYQNETIHKLKINNAYKNIQQSFEEFTLFNIKHIREIEKLLINDKPINGSDVIFLSKSFYIYKKHVEFSKLIQSEIQKTFAKNHQKTFLDLLLKTQLSQLDFFYQNYYSIVKNKRIRRLLNSKNSAYGIEKNDFKKNTLLQLNKKNYNSIQQNIQHLLVEGNLEISKASFSKLSGISYKKSALKKDYKIVKKQFRKDKPSNVGNAVMYPLSRAFGGIVGLFKFRKGYLYKNDSIYNEILNHLKPLDMIAEKTRFTFTDRVIPGHFGHVAIWLGTKEQLQENNLWELPSVVPYHKRIEEGLCIIESNRKGTHLKTLRDFMNIDEFAIVRITNFDELPISYKATIFENSFTQLGKKYDFNFDNETNNKLVCSELLYVVFGAIQWPNKHYLNRYTITPDNIVSLTLYENTPVSLHYYINAKNKTTIQEKTLLELAPSLGYQQKDNSFVQFNKDCEKQRNQTKEKCANNNVVLKYKQ